MTDHRECYRVRDLLLDVGAMRVTRNGEPVALTPLSFELLINLVRRAPDVVSRDDLLNATWKGVVVEPETLKQRVKLLRQALDDDPKSPRYIATVRGRGYQLVPEAEVIMAGNWRRRLEERLRGLISVGGSGRRMGVVFIAILIIAAATVGVFEVASAF